MITNQLDELPEQITAITSFKNYWEFGLNNSFNHNHFRALLLKKARLNARY